MKHIHRYARISHMDIQNTENSIPDCHVPDCTAQFCMTGFQIRIRFNARKYALDKVSSSDRRANNPDCFL